jgi:RHS repeat-associated protein
VQKKLTGPAGVIAQYDYQHDANGNITQIHDADPTYNRDFAYDDLNRLVEANSGTSLWGTGTYTYDLMGNMRSTSVTPARTFSYDGTTPKLLAVSTEGVSRSLSYDAGGNETGYIADRTYSPRNQLLSVTDSSPAGHTITYGYDGRGIRITRAETPVGGGTARALFCYSPELNLLGATRDDGPSYDIAWFAGRPVAQTTGSSLRYTFADHLGTPILQTDASGAVVWRAEYDPYGDIRQMRAGTPTDQPLRFPGQELTMTSEGGEEDYNIARWYRSSWGRYTSADPLLLSTRHENLYGYALDNPLRFTDRFGLSATLMCRQVYGAGESSLGKTVIDLYEPLHCRIRVKCNCPEPFDKTVGRELQNGKYPVTVEEFAFASFGSAWFGTPIQTPSGCQFEKCVLANATAQSRNPGLLPKYDALFGPNSNAWWKDTVGKCGGQINPPPKTWSGF